MNNKTYSKREKQMYLAGLSGQNILYGIITSTLAYYMQFTILIPAFWVGIIISTARIFDAVKDPFIGIFMNKKPERIKKYLQIFPIPTAVLTVLCFVNGIYNEKNPDFLIIIFAFVTYILWELLFTFTDIPINAYPTLITNSESDRNALLALRPVGAIVCSLCTLIVQPVSFALSGVMGSNSKSEQKAFICTVLVLSILGACLFQMTTVKSKQFIELKTENDKNQFRYFIKNPILKKILLSGILGSLRSMLGVVMTPLVNYYFASKNPVLSLFYTVVLGAGSFIGMIVSMCAAPRLSALYGNRNVYVFANIINIFPNVFLFVFYMFSKEKMTDIPSLLFMFVCLVISGICLSVSSTVQTFLINDAVDYEAKRSGKRPVALFFSCQTFLVKIAMGISSLAASMGYSFIGFSSEQANHINLFISGGGIPRLNHEFEPLMTMLFFLATIPAAIGSGACVTPFIKHKSVRKKEI